MFSTHLRITLTFSLILTRDSSKTSVETYCNSLSHRTQYSDQDVNPFFHSLHTQ